MAALKFEDQFEGQKVPQIEDYARLAEQFIPARRAIFVMIEAAFLELLPAGPVRILVAGAGGGEEILKLGTNQPEWSFAGVDTFEPMIELARQRLTGLPVNERTSLYVGSIDSFGQRDFDAATCILTAHFVPDDGRKLAFFKALSARLKPGAPLAIVDGVKSDSGRINQLQRRLWIRHAVCNGAPLDLAMYNAANFDKVAVVTPQREEELLQSAGFANITPFFQGLAIKGWLAFNGQ